MGDGALSIRFQTKCDGGFRTGRESAGMSHILANTVRLSLSKPLPFLCSALEEEQGFDKPSPNGVGIC